MDPLEYASYDGLGLADLIARGEVSAGEVAEAALAAIDLADGEVRAVVETYDDAPARTSADLGGGPFHGVPFLIKDIGPHFAGLKVEFGSRLCKDYSGTADDYLADLIRASGVNLVGRSNTPEFSMALCADNLLYGATSNPWRRGYSTSGSSGGAAAAVAAGLVPVAHGSDMGGSIRGPASWCGTVGLMPSRGRVSVGPQLAEGGNGMSQNFVLTRTVRDTAAMLDCLGVPQPGDPFVIPRPERSWVEYARPAGEPLRVAWSAAPLMEAPVDPEVAAAVEQAARALEDLGHHVVEDHPPVDLPAIDRALLDIWYYRFDRRLDALAAQMGRAVGPDTVERATLSFYQFAQRQDPERFWAGLDTLNEVRRAVGPFFTSYDAWLTPTCAQVSQPNGVFGMNVDVPPEEFLVREERPCQYLILNNVAGLPGISLPLALHSNGLPIGVQLSARPAAEHVLISLAAELEEALPWSGHVPELHVSRV
jgi:amidase